MTGRQTSSTSGFTLIEMVVVMLVFATVAAVFATTAARRERTPAPYDVAKRVQTMVFSARSDAIFSNRRTSIAIDVDTKQISYGKTGVLAVPENQSIKVLAGRELIAADGRVLLVFLPDGSSSGLELTLSDSRARTAELKVHWLTGLPRLSARVIQ